MILAENGIDKSNALEQNSVIKLLNLIGQTARQRRQPEIDEKLALRFAAFNQVMLPEEYEEQYKELVVEMDMKHTQMLQEVS